MVNTWFDSPLCFPFFVFPDQNVGLFLRRVEAVYEDISIIVCVWFILVRKKLKQPVLRLNYQCLSFNWSGDTAVLIAMDGERP